MANSNKRKISDGIRSSVKIKKIKKTKKKTLSFSVPEIETMRIEKKRRFVKNRNVSRRVSEEKPIFTKKLKITRKRNFLSFFSRNRNFIKWIFFVLMFFAIIAYISERNEKTTIIITPRDENISETKKITALLHPKFNELGFGVISLADVRTKTVDPKERVELLEKASGTITVFNNYSTEPQKLSPFTRFKSVSGKVFKLDENGIIIPGKSSGKPGKIEVKIYAEKTGSDYNIDVTDFTIPGFKESGLTEKYNNIYALSLKKFSGGENGHHFVLNDKQKKDSQNILESDLKEILIKKLEREKTDKVLIIDNSVQIIFKEPVFDKISDGYLVQQDAQIFAVFIEKKQLERYLKKTYLPDVNEEYITISDFENISFNYAGDEIDFDNLKSIKIDANFNTQFIWNIDNELVRESLLGLRKKDVPVILRELDEIQLANIDINPFWQKHISDRLDRIKINIEK
ncbi:MAG: hypothetical protein LR005_00665 [Candidatus Pacebacteria bacterium]|nr:hypothetical protein [Candidatus Paceibacterota bacterium]